MRIKINNAHIISPDNGIDGKGTVCIADSSIISVLTDTADFQADREIDANGKLVCPGFIDLCADFREPGLEHKATIMTEATAAAAAGVTGLVLTPDTHPVIDTTAVLELISQRAARAGQSRIYPLGALTVKLAGAQLSDIAALKQAGCLALTNARRPLNDLEVMRRAFEYAASFDMPVFIQAEETRLKNNGVMHEGRVSTRLGLPGIPATAETIAVNQTLLLVEQTGVQAHFSKLSCGQSVALIRAARRNGLAVSADVSINNLYLTDVDVDGFNADCHLHPPLRTGSDREALLAGIQDGSLSAICSDHQPHDKDAKSAPFSKTSPGASTIELLAPLIINLVERQQLNYAQAIAAVTAKPAKILGLESGSIAVGQKADLFIFDDDAAWTVTGDSLMSMGKNTPFINWEMPGRASHTIIDGKIIHAPS